MLHDTKTLKDRCGIESSLAGQAQIPSQLSRSLLAGESNALSDASPVPIGITLLRRTIWAINGATKFEALVKDLKEWNDSLACFQPPQQQEYANLALMAALINRRDGDQTLLPQIMETLEEDGPAVLGQTACLRRYNEFLEANALKPADSVQWDLDLPEADFSLDVTPHDSISQELRGQSYHRRQHGLYHPLS